MIRLKDRNQFMADWIRIAGDYARDHLGFEIPENSGIANDQLLAQNLERVPRKRQRKIKFADTFECSGKLLRGWEMLAAKIESGADLYPHLSRQIMRIEARDPMLMHWGINHFHLGTEPDPKHQGLIRGGKEIVYAYLDEDYFYAIALLPHGHWEDFELIETIKRNWPQHPNVDNSMILTNSYTKEEVLEFRENHVNAPASLADGSYYMGSGETVAGTSAFAMMKATSIRSYFARRQALFEQRFHEYFPDVIVESGAAPVAHLELDEDHSFLISLPELKRSTQLDIGIGDLIEMLKT